MKFFRIPEMAKQYTDYDMIRNHTELPEFPMTRIRLLLAFLDHPGLHDEKNELYALVTSLVQLGIDTHELVSETNDETEKKSVRSRQLKVLAGDYFSSRFYHLLSGAGQIEMIQQLSSAICEVNRLKMTFYTLMKQFRMSAEDYLDHMVRIKSQLFLGFGRLMEGVKSKLWPDLLRGITRCEVLMNEIARTKDMESFRDSWGYWHIMENGSKEERRQLELADKDESKFRPMLLKYNIKSQLIRMLEDQWNHLNRLFSELDSDKLVQELYHIGEPFLNLIAHPKAIEER